MNTSLLLRWVRRGIAGLLAVELAWLVVANLLLLGPLSDLLSRRPERMVIEWERAYSLYPTHVAARELTIRRQARRLQWSIRIPQAEGRLGLLPLLGKRLVLRSVSGRDLVVRARHRLDLEDDFSARAPFMPEIEGLNNPPERKPEVLYAKPKGGWRTRFSDVGPLTVAEIWIDHVRVGPGVTIAGDAEIVNRLHFELEDLEVTLDEVEARVADRVFAKAISGRAALELAPIPVPRRVPDGEPPPLPLEAANLQLELAGQLETGWLFDLLTERIPWLALSGGTAQLTASIKAVDGVLEDPSAAHLELDELEIGLASVAVSGGATIDWATSSKAIRAEDKTERETFDDKAWAAQVRTEKAQLTTRDGRSRLVDLGKLELAILGSHRELEAMRQDLALHGHLDGGTIADLSAWNRLLPSGLGARLTGGRGTVSARFDADVKSERGELKADVKVDDLTLDYYGQKVAGDAVVDLRMPVLELDTDRYSLDGTSIALDSKEALDPPWTGRIKITDGWLQPGASPYLLADADVDMDDSRIVLGMFLAQRDLPKWINKVIKVNPFEGKASLSLSPEEAVVGPFEVGGEHTEVEGVVLLKRKGQRGALLVSYRALDLGIELGPDGRDLKVLRAKRWFATAFPPLVAEAEKDRGR